MKRDKRKWWYVVGCYSGDRYARYATRAAATRGARRRERREAVMRGTYVVR